MTKKVTVQDLNIKTVNFPANQYIPKVEKKTQIYLHHTAGAASGVRTFEHWAKTKERIATCVCISGPGANEGDGTIVQGFSSKYWGYHLGVKSTVFRALGLPYLELNKSSIGIEINNFGYLTKDTEGNFRTYVGSIIPADQVIELKEPYKGHKYWHNYSDAQIESVRKLLLFWNAQYGISLEYNEDVWDVTKRALKGENGVFTHNSVRSDKTDIYPHPGLIKMWKSLTAKETKATPAKKKAAPKAASKTTTSTTKKAPAATTAKKRGPGRPKGSTKKQK